MKPGNIGIITTHGQELHRITSIDDAGLVYCQTMGEKPFHRVCKSSDFWVILDSFED